jgi:hypothetical protein
MTGALLIGGAVSIGVAVRILPGRIVHEVVQHTLDAISRRFALRRRRLHNRNSMTNRGIHAEQIAIGVPSTKISGVRLASRQIRIREVSASRGKAMRAEPISLLYEKQRVLHRRGLDHLEGEMMAFSREWDRAVDGSPNRLDAMVWGLTRLSKIITQIPIA